MARDFIRPDFFASALTSEDDFESGHDTFFNENRRLVEIESHGRGQGVEKGGCGGQSWEILIQPTGFDEKDFFAVLFQVDPGFRNTTQRFLSLVSAPSSR